MECKQKLKVKMGKSWKLKISDYDIISDYKLKATNWFSR